MKSQLIGATGTALGAISLVGLQVSAQETGMVKEISWHQKPLWSNEVVNYAIVLGTNALWAISVTLTNCMGEPTPYSRTRKC